MLARSIVMKGCLERFLLFTSINTVGDAYNFQRCVFYWKTYWIGCVDNPKVGGSNLLIGQYFPENCMKFKVIGQRVAGGAEIPVTSPLDPPMETISPCFKKTQMWQRGYETKKSQWKCIRKGNPGLATGFQYLTFIFHFFLQKVRTCQRRPAYLIERLQLSPARTDVHLETVFSSTDELQSQDNRTSLILFSLPQDINPFARKTKIWRVYLAYLIFKLTSWYFWQ